MLHRAPGLFDSSNEIFYHADKEFEEQKSCTFLPKKVTRGIQMCTRVQKCTRVHICNHYFVVFLEDFGQEIPKKNLMIIPRYEFDPGYPGSI